MDTVTINGVISAARLNGATSITGTVGPSNEATDIVAISGSTIPTDALTVTGAAYVQGAITLGDEATDTTAIRWPRNLATTFSGAVTLGDEATDTVTISGPTT